MSKVIDDKQRSIENEDRGLFPSTRDASIEAMPPLAGYELADQKVEAIFEHSGVKVLTRKGRQPISSVAGAGFQDVTRTYSPKDWRDRTYIEGNMQPMREPTSDKQAQPPEAIPAETSNMHKGEPGKISDEEKGISASDRGALDTRKRTPSQNGPIARLPLGYEKADVKLEEEGKSIAETVRKNIEQIPSDAFKTVLGIDKDAARGCWKVLDFPAFVDRYVEMYVIRRLMLLANEDIEGLGKLNERIDQIYAHLIGHSAVNFKIAHKIPVHLFKIQEPWSSSNPHVTYWRVAAALVMCAEDRRDNQEAVEQRKAAGRDGWKAWLQENAKQLRIYDNEKLMFAWNVIHWWHEFKMSWDNEHNHYDAIRPRFKLSEMGLDTYMAYEPSDAIHMLYLRAWDEFKLSTNLASFFQVPRAVGAKELRDYLANATIWEKVGFGYRLIAHLEKYDEYREWKEWTFPGKKIMMEQLEMWGPSPQMKQQKEYKRQGE